MTEKRYGMSNETGAFIDKKFNKEYTDDEIIDLLNELNNENKQLRNDCSILVQSNQNYRKEKEQLKQKIKFINEILSEDIGYIESLRKIEEALK